MSLLAIPARLRQSSAAALPVPWMLFLAAAALRLLLLAVFQAGSYLTGHNGVVDPYDSLSFDHFAWYAAQHFRAGQWVDLRASGLEGTWDVGYTYLVAFEYTLVGHVPDVARITNCLLAAFGAPAIYLAARSTTVGETVARRAGWLAAVWPLSLYWTGYDMLKDPLVWFFLAVALFALTGSDWRRRAVVGVVAVAGAYLTRSYMGPVLAIVLVVAAAVRRDWKGLSALLAGLAALEVVLVATGFPTAWTLAAYTRSAAEVTKSGEQVASTATLKNPVVVAKRLISGLPVAAFGPTFSLQSVLHPTIDSGMYPGLLVWVLLIPSTLIGYWRALKRRDPSLWGVGLLSISVWATLAVLYAGWAFRQREMAFPSTLLFTSLGLTRPWPRHWRWIYLGYLVLVLAGLLALKFRILHPIT